jgi:hypothetical protein
LVAGSKFHLINRSACDEAQARVCKSDFGALQIKSNASFESKNVRITFKRKDTTEGIQVVSVILQRRYPILKNENVHLTEILKDIQHSIFCSELFFQIKNEALKFTAFQSEERENNIVFIVTSDTVYIELDEYSLAISIFPNSVNGDDLDVENVLHSDLYDAACAVKALLQIQLRKLHQSTNMESVRFIPLFSLIFCIYLRAHI